MIIKYHKGFNAVIIAITISIVVILSALSAVNLRIVAEDIRESIHNYDIGVSKLTSLADDGVSVEDKFKHTLNTIPKILYNNIVGFDRLDIDELFFHIDFKDYQKILEDRKEAIKVGLLRNPVKVNAIIEFNGKKYKATVRLKGDLKDHWLSKYRMSLRVKLKGKKTIFGLREFSIQKPRVRMFPYDAAFQDILRVAGLLSNKHHYAKIKFNGKNWGVMNIESHASKEFLETEKHKDSLVVKFSNEDSWLYNKKSNNPDYSYRISNPVLYTKLYNSKKKLKDSLNRARYSYIVNQRLLGEPNLYNSDSYIDLLLLAHIWGADHVLYNNNVKHYFNPYTLKLEPISSDQVEPRVSDFMPCPPYHRFRMSDTYKSLYRKGVPITNLRKRFYNLQNIVISDIDNIIKSHQQFFPLDDIAPSNLIKKNISLMNDDYLNSILQDAICNEKHLVNKIPDSLNYPYHVYARHYASGSVEIFNLLKNEVKVLYIKDSLGNKYIINKTIAGYIDEDYTPVIMKTNYIGSYDNQLFVTTNYNGEERVTPLKITLVSEGVYNPLLFNTSEDLKFLHKVDKENWLITKGEWNVDRPLVINGNLKIESGTTLKFDKSAYLIVNGGLISEALEGEKTIFTSNDGSWGGVYIYNSSSESRLTNMIVENTSSIKDGILNLTGGMTFYNANVSLDNVVFLNSTSEDMLNIVNSKYSLNNITMSKIISDAIDFDFSKGSIDNIKISDVGGDALDFSGSVSMISNANIFNVRDKAFSAGEESRLNIKHSTINAVGVGVASKDGSHVKVLNTSFKNIALSPAMTYKKKSFYGDPKLILQSCEIDNFDDIIAQTGTSMIVNGEHITTRNVNIKKLYSSEVMRK